MAVPNQQPGHLDPLMSAPKFGTLIPNRVFVGGIRYSIDFHNRK